MDRPHSALSTALSILPCETDQAKPDRISRLARSTILSKILESTPPERRPFGSRPKQHRLGVLELAAPADFASYRTHRRILREPYKGIELRIPCQAGSASPQGRSNDNVGGYSPAAKAGPQASSFKSDAQRKISKIDQRNRPSLWGSRELNSRVLQWFVLCGIPYRGSGGACLI